VPIRSFLFVPADSERKLARGLESGADALILDLEDSVAAANRATARKLARAFLDGHDSSSVARYVRINPLASGLALDDLAATIAGRPDGILLPKCLPEDVRTLDHYLSAFEAAAGNPVGAIRIVAIATETPQAVFALGLAVPLGSFGCGSCGARHDLHPFSRSRGAEIRVHRGAPLRLHR
jgi:citrate lyase subunit beta/citryl-CoA lyase